MTTNPHIELQTELTRVINNAFSSGADVLFVLGILHIAMSEIELQAIAQKNAKAMTDGIVKAGNHIPKFDPKFLK